MSAFGQTCAGGDGWTQFGRAMHDLNVDTMCANTPQAKGRVERANLTLQNRLVKELRLADISTMAEANEFAWHFIEDYNRRFGRPALNPHNAHRPLRDDERLKDVFTWQEKRKVSRSLTLHYKRVMYLLDKTDAARRAMGKHVDVVENEAGEVTLYHDGHELPARPFDKLQHVRQAAIVENKMLSAALQFAAEQQAERDKKRLSGPSVTKREKRILHDKRCAAAEGRATKGAEHPSAASQGSRQSRQTKRNTNDRASSPFRRQTMA